MPLPRPEAPAAAARRNGRAQVHAPGRDLDRRLRLAAGRQLARGAARSRRLAAGHPRLLEAENAYADASAGAAPPLAAATRARNARAAQGGRQRAAGPDGPWAYYSRFRHGGQHRIFCRKPRAGGKETVLLDGDARARRAARSSTSATPAIRPIMRKFAWSADDKGVGNVRDPRPRLAADAICADRGRERHRRFRLDARLRGASSMSCRTSNHRPCRVMLHRLGTPPQARRLRLRGGRPRLVHQPRADAARRAARSSRCMATTRRRSHVVDLDRPAAPPRLIAPRRPGLRYEPLDHGDVFFIQTNATARATSRSSPRRRRAARRRTGAPFLPGSDGPADRDRRAVQATTSSLLAREDNRRASSCAISRAARSHEIAFEAETYFLEAGDRLRVRLADPPLQLFLAWPAARRPTITTWRRGSACSSRSR